MPTLYVTEQGARIEKEYKQILVTKEGEVIQAVRLRSIDEVVLIGSVGATTQALLALLDEGIGLTFITLSGKMRGRLNPTSLSNLELRLKQYQRQQDKTFCLEVAKSIVTGKLKNCRTMARRIIRKEQLNSTRLVSLNPTGVCSPKAVSVLENQMDQLDEIIKKIDKIEAPDVLRGFEGIGAKLYFSILKTGIKWDEKKGFIKRQRRPPKDPLNAALSFGYSLLSQALITAVEIVDLDPVAGFLHTNQYNRPSLALNLMEEFRPIIVDSIILRMVNHHMLKPKDFTETEDGQILFTKTGLKKYLSQFHQRINTPVFHPWAGRKLTYQKCFEVQARLLRKVITGEEPKYLPLLWK